MIFQMLLKCDDVNKIEAVLSGIANIVNREESVSLEICGDVFLYKNKRRTVIKKPEKKKAQPTKPTKTPSQKLEKRDDEYYCIPYKCSFKNIRRNNYCPFLI